MLTILSIPYNLVLDKNIQHFNENIRKNLDEGNVGCGVFVCLQKTFLIAEHDNLL